MEYIIYFVITIAILVFVHEFGHFAAAKLSGMRVDIFAIGFYKRLFGWNKLSGFTFGELPKDFDGMGNTDYRLCLLPLGGYVKISGMIDESFDIKYTENEPQPYEFRSKPMGKKIFVISAGVLMNLLLALFIFWGMNFFQGKQVTKTTTIGYVEPHSTADSLGFKAGDKLLAINKTQVNSWEELRTELYINSIGSDVAVKLIRDGSEEIIKVPRNRIPDETEKVFLIPAGIKPAIQEVLSGSPAEKAGVKARDIFLRLNNVPLFSSQQTTEIISKNKGNQLPLVVKRGADTLNLSVTPGANGLIGVRIGNIFEGKVEYISYGFFKSFYLGWEDIVRMTDLTFSMLGKVFSGDIEFGKAFGGPIKIAQVAAKSADSGLASFLYFLALLSLSLAIINIMPFPVLDGGHLVFIIIEGIIKREIPVKVKLAIQNAGLIILLLLMAFIIYNDLISL